MSNRVFYILIFIVFVAAITFHVLLKRRTAQKYGQHAAVETETATGTGTYNYDVVVDNYFGENVGGDTSATTEQPTGK